MDLSMFFSPYLCYPCTVYSVKRSRCRGKSIPRSITLVNSFDCLPRSFLTGLCHMAHHSSGQDSRHLQERVNASSWEPVVAARQLILVKQFRAFYVVRLPPLRAVCLPAQ